MFQMIFDTGNDAFAGGFGHAEVARILRDAAEKIEKGLTDGGCRDLNGNRVGDFALNFAVSMRRRA